MTKPSEEDKNAGLKHKYNITHADGSPVDSGAKYFVLRTDFHDDCDPNHIEACRQAIHEYAVWIQAHIPKLSRDIMDHLSFSTTKYDWDEKTLRHTTERGEE